MFIVVPGYCAKGIGSMYRRSMLISVPGSVYRRIIVISLLTGIILFIVLLCGSFVYTPEQWDTGADQHDWSVSDGSSASMHGDSSYSKPDMFIGGEKVTGYLVSKPHAKYHHLHYRSSKGHPRSINHKNKSYRDIGVYHTYRGCIVVGHCNGNLDNGKPR